MSGIDNRFPSPGADTRFPSPGVDMRFLSGGVDAYFPSPGVDARFSAFAFQLFIPSGATRLVTADSLTFQVRE